MKKILSISLLCALLLTGCQSGGGSEASGSTASESSASTPVSSESAPESAPESSEAESSYTFTDSLGREFTFDGPVDAVAPSGLLSQLVIYAVAPDTLVGWSNEWTSGAEQYIPEEYRSLPLIGQIYGTNTEFSVEELLAHDPDIVLDIGEPKDGMAEDFAALEEQTGIPFVHIDATMETMPEAFTMTGELLGIEETAAVYADYCDEVYSRTLEIMEQVGEDKTSVLYLTGDDGLNVIANGSYHAEILDLIGDNAAVVDEPSSKGTGNETDLEQIMLWDPEVIFFAPGSVYDTAASNPLWQGLSAIQSGQYYEVPSGPYNWMGFPPSIQRYLGMMWMEKVLYPQYAGFDLMEEIQRYYDLFYHYDLSEEEYAQLTERSLP